MARIIHEVRPRFVFVENSPMLTSRGLGTVLGDLASMGFDARWGVLGAADVGANHERERIWIVASNPNVPQLKRGKLSSRKEPSYPVTSDSCWWKDSSRIHRMDDGVASRVDRLKAIGNGQVPLCAATAWRILSESATGAKSDMS
jgi:DNA (cytosine-5)-methyltransferase 1